MESNKISGGSTTLVYHKAIETKKSVEEKKESVAEIKEIKLKMPKKVKWT